MKILFYPYFFLAPVNEAFPFHTVTPTVSKLEFDVYNYKPPN